MADDPTENPRAAAIEQLEQFGLSGYAARTFVALAILGTGTARDVSQISEVPRTRVYDAIDELQERSLVDVQHSSPKEFWAISAETATRTSSASNNTARASCGRRSGNSNRQSAKSNSGASGPSTGRRRSRTGYWSFPTPPRRKSST